MAVIRSKTEIDLRIPGGPMLRAGRKVRIDRWDVVKEHATVKAWLAAGVIEEVAPHDLDHDGDGKKGGSEKQEPTERLAELRAAYQDRFGKRAWHGWSEDELKAKIEAGI